MADSVAVHRRTVLLTLAFGSAVTFVAIYLLGVRTTWGQRLDATALRGRSALRPRTIHAAHELLNTISIASLVLVGGLIVLIALARRRPLLAMGAAIVIGGSTVTSELLKHVILQRPNLGIFDAVGPHASFPSGHTTVAFSLAIAALLVAPSHNRAAVGILGSLYTIGIAVGVIATANHRPSDAIGAVLVVTAWAAVVAAVLLSVSFATPRDARDRRVSPALAFGGRGTARVRVRRAHRNGVRDPTGPAGNDRGLRRVRRRVRGDHRGHPRRDGRAARRVARGLARPAPRRRRDRRRLSPRSGSPGRRTHVAQEEETVVVDEAVREVPRARVRVRPVDDPSGTTGDHPR